MPVYRTITSYFSPSPRFSPLASNRSVSVSSVNTPSAGTSSNANEVQSPNSMFEVDGIVLDQNSLDDYFDFDPDAEDNESSEPDPVGEAEVDPTFWAFAGPDIPIRFRTVRPSLDVDRGGLGIVKSFGTRAVPNWTLTEKMALVVASPGRPQEHRIESALSLQDWNRQHYGKQTQSERAHEILYGDQNVKLLPQNTEDAEFEMAMDIDSILWTTEHWPLDVDVQFTPFPLRTATIMKSNRLDVGIAGVEDRVPLSTIPNMTICSSGFEDRLWSSVFFPKLRSWQGSRWLNFVGDDDMAFWYDHIMRPALLQATEAYGDPYILGRLPINYEMAGTLARNDRGHYQSRKVPVPAALWSRALKLATARVETRGPDEPQYAKFGGFFFHHKAQGIKALTNVNREANPLDAALRSNNIPQPTNRSTDLIIDVGYYISPQIENTTLLWNLPKLHDKLKRLGWTLGAEDKWCGTEGIGGVRLYPPPGRVHESHLCYLQAYHGEKDITYRSSESSLGLRWSRRDLFKNSPRFQANMDDLESAFTDSAQQAQPARFELRMAYGAAQRIVAANGGLVLANLKDCLISIPTIEVARFKLAHLRGYAHIVNSVQMNLVTSAQQKDPRHAMFVDLLIQMIQGLVKRQQDDSYCRYLAKSSGALDKHVEHGRLVVDRNFVSLDQLTLNPDTAITIPRALRLDTTHGTFRQLGNAARAVDPLPFVEWALPEVVENLAEEELALVPETAFLAPLRIRAGHPQDLRLWVEDIWETFRKEVWAKAIRSHLRDPASAQQPMRFDLEFFLMAFRRLKIIRYQPNSMNSFTWFGLFSLFFESQAVGTHANNRQKDWSGLKYRDHYEQLSAVLGDHRGLLRVLLWMRFKATDAMPGATVERIWKSERGTRITVKDINGMGEPTEVSELIQRYRI